MEQGKWSPERLLRVSVHHLRLRDFANCRKYALLAQQSEPNLAGLDQILSVADVLLASERRLVDNALDWYSVLQLPTGPEGTSRLAIRSQFKKLIILVNPKKNNLPLAQKAFDLVCDAWSVLSNPERKARYDNEINSYHCRPQKKGKSVESEKNNGNGTGTIWTLCPYCWFMYEYEGLYEECCLRCQNCSRPFHAVAVRAPPSIVVVEGREGYNCAFGFSPFGYGLDAYLGYKTVNGSGCNDGVNPVVEISDDSDDDGGPRKAKGSIAKNDMEDVNYGAGDAQENGVKYEDERVKLGKGDVMKENGEAAAGNGGKKVMGRAKTVVKNTMKRMGKGMKTKRNEGWGGPGVGGANINAGFEKTIIENGEDINAASELKNSFFEGELEVFEVADDIYVGIRSTT